MRLSLKPGQVVFELNLKTGVMGCSDVFAKDSEDVVVEDGVLLCVAINLKNAQRKFENKLGFRLHL